MSMLQRLWSVIDKMGEVEFMVLFTICWLIVLIGFHLWIRRFLKKRKEKFEWWKYCEGFGYVPEQHLKEKSLGPVSGSVLGSALGSALGEIDEVNRQEYRKRFGHKKVDKAREEEDRTKANIYIRSNWPIE